MIELQQVSKSFGAERGVGPIDLAAGPGATTVLIGPSGCGKSTVLRLMLGLVLPDEGRVLFRGEVVRPDALPMLRRRTGYVIQEGGLFPHLTAAGNVTLMARHLSWPKDRIGARLAELARLVQLPAQALERYPAQLSGGQRQRVALMRALMLDPDLLLLDEPLGALDPMIRAELQEDLKAVFRTLEKTVVLVTHDMGEAVFFGDRVVLLNEGRVVQAGPPGDLFTAPADPFVRRFVGAQRSLAQALGEGRS